MTKRIQSRRPGQIAKRRREYPVAIDHSVEYLIRDDLSSLFTELRARDLPRKTRFKYEYLEREIFSKYLDPNLKNGARDREEAAIKKWQSSELRNAKTNVRLTCLDAIFNVSKHGNRTVTADAILATAAKYVSDVLGSSPWVGPSGPSIEVLRGTFTSGASTQFARGDGMVAKKFMDEAHATQSAVPWITYIRDLEAGWRVISDNARGKPLEIDVVQGSVLFTVPKSTEIDRCACKEPGLNMYLQKGVGAFIRRRLRSVARLDLSDQTHNQELARIGSLGSLATLDLSSASDTISSALVFRLLPLDWFCYLDDIRSKWTRVRDEWVELDMFSSMGNAFTFELETLLFWALASACKYHLGVRGAVSVYGDDIIVPSQCAGFIARFFAYVGFKVNPKKSYWAGPFRESCGKHWYAGTDVTPFYVREPIATLPRLIHFLNRLRLWAGQGGGMDDDFFPLWEKYSSLVPRRLRGGSDLNSIGQLVSYERPMDRLVSIPRKEEDVPEVGRYLHWLRVADTRAPKSAPGVRLCLTLGQAGFVLVYQDTVEALVTSIDEVATRRFYAAPSVTDGTHGILLWLLEEFPVLRAMNALEA